MALLVDIPKVNGDYDSDKKILEAVDILHENKEINNLTVENEALEKQIKTLREKLDQRELQNKNERLKMKYDLLRQN